MKLTVKFFSARRLACLFATGVALSLSHVASAGVIPADTFTFAIAGFNSTSGVGYILGTGESAIFGQTTTYAGAGYNGQSYTMSSYEVVGATTTTDHFQLTTPSNFLTTKTVNGVSMTALEFDIGDANSGVGVSTGADALNFTSAVGAATSGSIVYSAANTVFNLTPSVTLTNGGLSLAMAEGVNYGTNAISALAIHQFDFSITYANPVVAAAAVPEPASTALFLTGLGLMGFTVARRKKN